MLSPLACSRGLLTFEYLVQLKTRVRLLEERVLDAAERRRMPDFRVDLDRRGRQAVGEELAMRFKASAFPQIAVEAVVYREVASELEGL